MIARLMTAAMLAGALASPLAAQVRIHVVDENGRPVSDVRIDVLGRAELLGTAFTTADGVVARSFVTPAPHAPIRTCPPPTRDSVPQTSNGTCFPPAIAPATQASASSQIRREHLRACASPSAWPSTGGGSEGG